MPDLPTIDDPWVGKVLDHRFDVLGLLAKGGMGAIYRCRERSTGTQLAIKLILEDWNAEEEVQARFEREIKATMEVQHPNVVRLLGHGRTEDGQRYYAMELLEGQSLFELMENEGPLDTQTIAHIGAQVARGLQAAHDQGVIHRDLKPENIVVMPDLQAKVVDFGLALLEGRGSSNPDRLTQMGTRIGSPLYMAPEYGEHGQLDHRSDLYALGAILYEVATDAPLFRGNPYEIIAHHTQTPHTPIDERRPGRHPAWFCRAIDALLAKDPDQRVQTATDAAALLSRAPDVAPDLRSVVPTDGPPPIRTQSGARGMSALPMLLLLAAALWHGLMIGTTVGSEKNRPTTAILTHQMAWAVASAGGNPYDAAALNKEGRAQRVGAPVNRSFAPPTWLAAMAWTAALPHETAWGVFLGLQEALLIATLLLCWRWWQPLGLAPPLALAMAAAALSGTAQALDAGWPVLVTLFLWCLALYRQERWDGGLWLGLALCVTPRSLILAPLWIFRGRLTELAIAGATVAVGSLIALGVLGPATTAAYYTDVLPTALMGDLTGLGLRFDVYANLASAHLVSGWVPGASGQSMSTTALAICWAIGLAGLGALALGYRHSEDPWHQRSTEALWLLGVLWLPFFGTEHQLPWVLPAIGLTVGALWQGRLSSSWAVILGLSIALLLYPLTPLRSLHQTILAPDAPWLAPFGRELKLMALLVIAGATATVTRSRPDME